MKEASGGRRYVAPWAYWESDEALRIEEVLVEGSPYTREDVLMLHLRRARAAATARELHGALREAHERLMGLGVFRQVQFVVDKAKEASRCNVMVKVSELPRKEYGGGVGLGDVDQVVLSGTSAVLNAWGRAETLRATVQHSAPGLSNYSSLETTVHKPLLFEERLRNGVAHAGFRYSSIERAEGKHHEQRGVAWLGLEEGGNAHWPTKTLFKLAHEVRRLNPLGGASFANAEQSAWATKTSVIYERDVDTRDSPLMPMSGALARMTHELAFDVARLQPMFFKTEGVINRTLPLNEEVSLFFRLRGGYIIPLRGREPAPGRASRSVPTIDAFHLGGAHQVPGFNTRGIGHNAAGESLGASAYWLASAHCFFGLGSVMPKWIKGHVHASACSVADLIAGPADQRSLSTLLQPSAARASVGAGVVIALLGTGRLTFTYSRVLNSLPGDSTASKIQFGFTSSFD